MFNKMLLATAAVIVTVAGSSAADLPSKKAAPATYVKICDTYGAGFFFIPGSDTCVKLGGRIRYDLAYMPTGDYYSATTGLKDVSVQDTYGQHVRARVNLDVRTGTEYGTVRTYLGLQSAFSTGLLSSVQSPYADFDANSYIKKSTTVPSIEMAYMQFAGFTAGKMPSIVAGDWTAGNTMNYNRYAGFSTGVYGIAYTAVLGGGVSATVGFEDNDGIDGNNVALFGNTVGTAGSSSTPLKMKLEAPYQTPYNKLPLIAGKLVWDQAWGQIQVSGGVAQNRSVLYNTDATTGLPSATSGTVYDKTMTGYAFGGQLTLNADMIAKGDKFYLLAGYSNGINKLGYKNASKESGLPRNVDGITQSYKNFTCFDQAPFQCENTKSTFADLAFLHYWTPSIRQNVIAGMAWVDPGSLASTSSRVGSAATQKATFTQVGTNVFWTPVKGFDIGVEVMYDRSNVSAYASTIKAPGCMTSGLATACSTSGDNFTYRLRVQRDF